jgi:GH43 family beta-xylosidase
VVQALKECRDALRARERSLEFHAITANLRERRFCMLRYLNPVYPEYFADPFVWAHDGIYYAVGTGPITAAEKRWGNELCSSYRMGGEERAFPLLRSLDFVNWTAVGGALRVPGDLQDAEFWAPEVAFDGARFHLYYSAAVRGLEHKLRVAISTRPEGPYEDAGFLMPDADSCPFAIDAHPFQDVDGQWYLFYARDYLDFGEEVRAGTALAVDRLESMTRLAGEPQVVLRARHDWQRFQANRTMYGRPYDWHTLEGPCVRRQGGLYYCFYSGGCFENETYGVDYGVASHALGPYSGAGCEGGARVLRTVANRVIGPGHQSIVPGPDRATEYLVYHAWDPAMTARRMCLDQLLWTPEGPRCAGPTWTPQEVRTGRLQAA